jgi:hypothetical protein
MKRSLSFILIGAAAAWTLGGCGGESNPPDDVIEGSEGTDEEEDADVDDGRRPDDGVEPGDGDAETPEEAPEDVPEDVEATDVPEEVPVACTNDVDCDDSLVCTADTCDPASHTCVHVPNDALCSDSIACNGAEVCTPGVGCEDGTPVNCDDGVDCTTDSCNPADGSCSNVADDAACDDGIDCTTDSCDPATGGCSNLPDDGACDDLNPCNGVEVCSPGVGCEDGMPVDCDDGVACTADACNPLDGTCTNDPDDAACPPSALCAGAPFCDPTAGCVVTAPPSCNDGVDCTVDACDPATGACIHVLEDARCSDGVFCNGDEVCDGTLDCIPGLRDCSDRVGCTVDTCDETADACVWTPDPTPCRDANLCNGTEVCNSVLGCQPGAPVDCDDGFACTTDACTPATGACTHVPNSAACDDGLACNGIEQCFLGMGCLPGAAMDCVDAIVCTTDSCDETTDACQHVASHAACPPGQVCIPARGGCVPGTSCTTSSECSDGVYCNGPEQCVASVCVGGTPIDCVDTDACTVDTCSEAGATCVHAPQDRDADTYGDAACGGTDCNDLDAAVHPGAADPCDGVDNDCDGSTDGGLLPSGSACSAHAQCCTGSCVAGICTTGYGLCESPGATCATPAECCSGRCEVVAGGARECVGSGTCAGVTEICLFSVDCCSTWCVAGACATGSTCGVIGTTCTTAVQCCSGICSAGRCQSVGGTCSPLGESCTSGNGCCSGFCDAGRCGIGFFCRASGELCNEGADCCTGICEGYTPTTPGRCAFLGGCLTVGQPCTGNRNCCSKACVDPGTGVRVCTYLSGCRPTGELCTTTGECCASLCERDDRGRSWRCQNPPGCQPAGEMCIAGATNNCCGGHEYCRPTIAGVYRCWSPGWTDCLAGGELCHFGDECCSGVCTVWPDGFYRCGSTCLPEGGGCTADGDCCAPDVCLDAVCLPPDTPCVPLGGICSVNADCCTLLCTDGRCIVNPAG